MEKKIWKISSSVGGKKGFKDGIGTVAEFNLPHDVTVNSSGFIYVADYYNHRIRKITPGGVVSTLAGNGEYGYQDGTGTAAQFYGPSGVAVDSGGNVYVADAGNCRIRKITPAGEVTTLAGNGIIGFKDGAGEEAEFIIPSGVALDSFGNVYVADYFNNRIRKITPAGEVSTIAGSTEGKQNGTGEAAQFNLPSGVAVDSSGFVYVADTDNHRIRKITPEGEVSTFVGSSQGYKDGAGTAAQFNEPTGVAVDSSGNLYVADTENHRIRKITPEREAITLIGSEARFNDPTGVAVDSGGNVYVADFKNNRIRKTEYK